MRSRFPGEVVQIGAAQEQSNSLQTTSRPLRYGDRVTKDQLLVAVWNTDLGNKKNDLVDALKCYLEPHFDNETQTVIPMNT